LRLRSRFRCSQRRSLRSGSLPGRVSGENYGKSYDAGYSDRSDVRPERQLRPGGPPAVAWRQIARATAEAYGCKLAAHGDETSGVDLTVTASQSAPPGRACRRTGPATGPLPAASGCRWPRGRNGDGHTKKGRPLRGVSSREPLGSSAGLSP
jgi:hypothetical protein